MCIVRIMTKIIGTYGNKAKEKDIQNEMANPEIASNFDKLGPLQEQLDEIQKQLDTANNNWERLSKN